MSIIFEGIDGTGKTTKALELCRQLSSFFYIHNFVKVKNELDTTSECTKETLLLSSTFDIAFDRSFIISEYVYATVLNRKSYVTREVLQKIINIVNQEQHTIWLLLAKHPTQLFQKDEDKHLPMTLLNDMYHQLLVKELRIDNLIVTPV